MDIDCCVGPSSSLLVAYFDTLLMTVVGGEEDNTLAMGEDKVRGKVQEKQDTVGNQGA